MKKVLLILLAVILIFFGVYGTYHFFQIKRAEIELSRAVGEIREGSYGRAVSTLRSTVSRYHQQAIQASGLYMLAQVYEKMNRYEAALGTYGTVLAGDRVWKGNNWYARSLIAVSRLHRKELVRTSEHKKTVLDEYVNRMRTELNEMSRRGSLGILRRNTVLLAYSLMNSGTLIINGVRDDTVEDDLLLELGFLYLDTGRYDDAKKILLTLDTKAAKFGLARSYLESGDFESGMELLEQLLPYDATGEINSYYTEKTYLYAERFLFDRPEEALPLLRRIDERNPRSEYGELALYQLIRYYYGSGDYKTALTLVGKALDNGVRDKDEDITLLKGFILYDNRDFLSALKTFRQFITVYPSSVRLQEARQWKAMCERSIKYLG